MGTGTNVEKVSNQEKEIDLVDLGKKIWVKRKLILKGSLIGLVVGIVIAYSIPKEYTTTVILAPETSSSTSAGSVGALAAMAGFNLGGGAVNEGQMSPELYPSIAESTPFILGLFNVGVIDVERKIDSTLFYYMKEEQKGAWWSKILSFPGSIMGLFSDEGSNNISKKINPFALTREQNNIFNNLKNRVTITVEKKTGVISLSSTMQSPEISASLADTLTSYLQSYIISYRTQKARQDLSFTERLYTEAKKDYSEAQQRYARYLDENQNIILASYRVNQEKLQNEVALTYSVYNQMAQQLQLAKVKVQDTTPVYTIIQPAVVPLFPSKPNKKIIIGGFLILAIGLSSGFVLGKEIWLDMKNK